MTDSKNEIKRMVEGKIKIQNAKKIVYIVEKIIDLNKQNQTGKDIETLRPN